MEFLDHLTPDCPPSDAISPGIEVYYLVSEDPPIYQDFLSLKERRPDQSFENLSEDCQSCGLSVFPDLAGIELAKSVSRKLRKMKVARAYLVEDSGRIKNTPSQRTGDTHHTWWPAREVNPTTLFRVIV